MGSRIGAILAGMKQKGHSKGQPKVSSDVGKTIKIPRVKGTSGVTVPNVSTKSKPMKPKW